MIAAAPPDRVAPPIPARPGVLLLLAVGLGQEWLPAAVGPLAMPAWWVVVAVAVATLLVLWRGRWLFPALFAMAVATAWQQGNTAAAARADGRRVAAELMGGGRPLVQVDGIVAATPRRGPTSWTVLLGAGATTEWEGNVVAFPLPTAVRVPVGLADEAGMEALVPGDRLVAAGQWLALATTAEPGEPEEWLAAIGAGALLRARLTTPVANRGGVLREWRRAAWQLGHDLERLLAAHLAPDRAAVLAAMTLGRTASLSPEQRDAFRRSGLMHLFAVSGLHTGIVGLVVLFGLRLLGLPLWLRLLLLVLMVGGFAALVGGRASVLRAATLLVLFEASELLRRPVEPMAMLATVAAAMALLSPGLLRHVDFQMTFLCVAALIVVGPWMLEVRRALGRRLGWGRLATAAIATVETLIASTAIQLALLPVLAGRMGEVSLVAPLANVLCLATAGWVIVTTLFVLFAGFWAGALWGGLLPVAGWGAGLLDAAAHGLAAIPFAAVAAPPWPAWAALVWLALLVAGPWAALRHPIRPRRPAWAFAPGALAAGCLLLVPLVRPPAGGELQLWFLDVGQGDAILVRSPAGAWGLVDAGPPRMAHQLVGMLRRRGVDRLDWAVATHADADHIGGLAEVLDAIPCGRLYVGGGIAPTGEFAELAAVVARRRIPVATVRRGVGWLLPGGGVVDVLHPTDPFVDATDERNDASVVLLLRLGGRAVLLAGDAESPAEADLIAAVPRLLGADVLKAGHHGAATSTGGDWLDVVAPRLVVLSCGRNNSYGHPAPAVLDRLAARGIEVARTDMGGTIHLRIGRDGQVRWSSSR